MIYLVIALSIIAAFSIASARHERKRNEGLERITVMLYLSQGPMTGRQLFEILGWRAYAVLGKLEQTQCLVREGRTGSFADCTYYLTRFGQLELLSAKP